jgi:hypothetical protein
LPGAPKVLVLGASGTLGRRVARLVEGAAPGIAVIGAGRRAPPARGRGGAGARRLDLGDPASFAPALEGVRVLVHAAGPYDRDPRPLADACLRAGVHWVDLAEDPAFVARVREAASAPEARAAAVPGCSTLPALVEALAAGLPAQRELASVDAILALGSRNEVSAGLLFGLLRPLGAATPETREGRWFAALETHVFRDGAARRVGRYPSGLEKGVGVGAGSGPGASTLPLRFWFGFDRAWLGAALAAAGRVLPRIPSPALARLARAAAPFASALRPFGTPRGRLAVLARDAQGRVRAGIEVHKVDEGLDVPAAPAAWAAALLATRGEGLRGPLRLVDLLPPAALLERLRALGCEVWRFEEP